MFTRCPSCESWFAIRAVHLRAGAGMVHCGRCGSRFDALATLRDEPPAELFPDVEDDASGVPELTLGLAPLAAAEAPAAAAPPAPEAAGSVAPAPAEGAAPSGETAPEEAPQPEPAGGETFVLLPPDEAVPPPAAEVTPTAGAPAEAPGAEETAGLAMAEAAPEEAAAGQEAGQPASLPPELAPPEPAPAGRRWPWAAAAAVLALALAGQLAWMNLEALAATPARPLLARACALAGCTLPARRDPGAFVVTERALTAHPQRRGALRFTATLVNGADFAQPPPVIELRLSDLEGRLVGARRFRPAEYLAGGTAAPVPPGGTVTVRLDLLDPGGAVSFRIAFR